MMATTHVFAGLALVAPVAYHVPEFAPALAAGAILGGVAPDVDVAFDHRRTLHFPVVGGPIAAGSLALALAAPTAVTAGVAACCVAAWIHAASDALGAGPDLDPWRNPSDRAVYDHVRDRWIRPRRWIRYDGAPEDAVVASALAIPSLVVFEGWVATVVVAGLAISLGYALLRRRLVEWAPDRLG